MAVKPLLHIRRNLPLGCDVCSFGMDTMYRLQVALANNTPPLNDVFSFI